MCSSARGFIHRSPRRIRHGRRLRPACVLVHLLGVAVDAMEEKGAVTPAPVQQKEDLGSISTARPWRARAAARSTIASSVCVASTWRTSHSDASPPRQREPAAGAENHDLESGADPERGAWESGACGKDRHGRDRARHAQAPVHGGDHCHCPAIHVGDDQGGCDWLSPWRRVPLR